MFVDPAKTYPDIQWNNINNINVLARISILARELSKKEKLLHNMETNEKESKDVKSKIEKV